MSIEEQYRRRRWAKRPQTWNGWWFVALLQEHVVLQRLARILLLGAVMTTVACVAGMVMAEEQVPDLTAVLRVVGRFTAAHACPIAADRALTASHVTDLRPFDHEVPLWPYRFEGGGTEGVAVPHGVAASADLGMLKPEQPFTRWYAIAERAPAVGERVWMLAYDWRRKKAAYGDQVISGKVTRIVAGHIIMDEAVPSGASGSCVLNAAAEVVGILVWGQKTDDLGEASIAVAVFGPWGAIKEEER